MEEVAVEVLEADDEALLAEVPEEELEDVDDPVASLLAVELDVGG